MKVEFDESLVTGNTMIDNQHKELIAKIDALLTCCEQGGGKVQAIKMLDYLENYTEFHFAEEEKLQKEVSYPALEGHRQKHEEFKKAVEVLYDMLVEEEGPSEAFVAAVKKNVVDWLFDHIKNMDQALATYIKQAE